MPPDVAIIDAPANPGQADRVAAAAAKTEIRVSGMKPAAAAPAAKAAPAIAPPIEPAAVKPGSAKEKMFKNLRDRAKPDPGTEDQPGPPTKPAVAGKAEKPAVEVEAEAETETPAEPAPANGKKPKVNPWKLVDEYKAKTKELEAQILETGKRAIAEPEWKKVQDELASQKKRNEELEQHMRYTDYSKSAEFSEKYQKPYEQAWTRAMGDLKGLTVDDGAGNQRDLSPDDILELVNEPDLRKARAAATEKFGEFADDVMTHRKEIRKLYDEQSAALEKAKTDAGERSKQQEVQHKQMTTGILADWKTFNDEAVADPKFGQFFKPKEGDAEGNQRLAKGFELADRAFSESPLAPGLNAEQRKDIVKRQAVIRNRAAACGRLIHWNNTLEARNKELESELAQYKGSEPATEGGGKEPTNPANKGSAMDRMQAELRKKAVNR